MIQATFVLSAASAADFPRTGVPEIAMVGRSNVGKSSLINAIVQKTIARTSAAPGKTRLANYYLIEAPNPNPQSLPSFYLVDLPGYGYARGGETSVQTFETLTNEYFGSRDGRALAGVLHLVDARHPKLPQDIAAHGWIMRTRLPIAVVATKMDKLARAAQSATLKQLQETYDVPVMPESALKHEGVDDIGRLIRRWASEGGA